MIYSFYDILEGLT